MDLKQLQEAKEYLIRVQAWYMSRYNLPIDDENVEELQNSIDIIHDLIENY